MSWLTEAVLSPFPTIFHLRWCGLALWTDSRKFLHHGTVTTPAELTLFI